MSFWAGKRLVERLRQEKLIEPFSHGRVECAAYTLSLGAFAFTTTDKPGQAENQPTVGVVELEEKQQISIPPGQFAFLLTEETVTVPHDAIAFISVKTRRKFQGLVNVSGFHVDPGWSSRLIFGVFNGGPRPIVLERGQPLFLIFFADLSAEPSQPLSVDNENVYRGGNRYTNIPAELVEKMSGEVPSLYRLSRVTKDLESGLKDVQSTTKYFQLVSGLSLLISLAVLALLSKAVFFPPPPSPTIVETRSLDRTDVGNVAPTTNAPQPVPPVQVIMTPECAPTCVPPKKDAPSKRGNRQTGQDSH